MLTSPWEVLLRKKKNLLGILTECALCGLVCVDVTQALPSYESLNASMYVVQAGFQDYFFPLYDKTATRQSLLDKVESVVSAIAELIEVSLFLCLDASQKGHKIGVPCSLESVASVLSHSIKCHATLSLCDIRFFSSCHPMNSRKLMWVSDKSDV